MIGRRGEKGFADEYANVIFALISLYEVTFRAEYLEKAQRFLNKMLTEFYDSEEGGFFLYGRENEQLIFSPRKLMMEPFQAVTQSWHIILCDYMN